MRRAAGTVVGALLACVAAAGPVRAGAAGGAPVWVDTDAACDGSGSGDVDDCLALLHLLAVAPTRVAGLSTTFGNASRTTADASVAELLGALGSSAPIDSGATRDGDCDTAAARAMRARLREPGRLQVLALGPLTNVACAIGGRPSVAARVERIVAVMGARPGQLFHPAEERSRDALLGHGPMFRDLNFRRDEDAARAIVASGIPLVLVPYEAGRLREVGAHELDELARRGPACALVARQARPWLSFWKHTAGRDGFFPFDLVAATLVTGSEVFTCTQQEVRVTRDRRIGWFGHPFRLLMLAGTPAHAAATASVCRPAGTRRRIDVGRLFPTGGSHV